MNDLIQARVLKGFRDFLPEAEIKRKKIQFILEEVFKSYGFLPIDTPVLEYAEVLLGKGGGETDKQVYRFLDHGGRDVAMRFDLTVPFARFMAEHRSELYLPFKRYHIGKVYRGENTQRGRYREFMQCDFDIVGTDCASADFEILALMKGSLEALGISKFRIHLSNRAVFNRVIDRLGAAGKSVGILRIVDKIHKVGREQVREMIGRELDSRAADAILDFITPGSDQEETLEKMTRIAGGEDEDSRRLSDIFSLMKTLDMERYFFLDPSITRGLDYYTGVVFETFLSDIPEIGSVCSGGRYNNLASLYTREQLPGVGSSIGLDRLIAALDALGSGLRGDETPRVLVLCFDYKFLGYYHDLAGRFRLSGIASEVFPENKKLSAQFNFAEKKNIGFAAICGEDEVASRSLTLKNLRTRENHEKISFEKAIEIIKK